MDNKKYTDKLLIGEINFTDSVNEVSVGRPNLDKFGTCKIYVYGNEGPIPHFHLEKSNGEVICCICIFEAKYFHQETYPTILSSKQKKELNKYMKTYTKNSFGAKLTVWETAANAWNGANEKYAVTPNQSLVQPDYTDLPSVFGESDIVDDIVETMQ